MEQGENEIFLYGILLAPLIVLCVAAVYMNIIRPFSEGRRYIKAEIHRSYNESEYRYWKRELKKLYISHISILGKYIVKRMR